MADVRKCDLEIMCIPRTLRFSRQREFSSGSYQTFTAERNVGVRSPSTPFFSNFLFTTIFKKLLLLFSNLSLLKFCTTLISYIVCNIDSCNEIKENKLIFLFVQLKMYLYISHKYEFTSIT